MDNLVSLFMLACTVWYGVVLASALKTYSYERE